jgi:hypothetical protein
MKIVKTLSEIRLFIITMIGGDEENKYVDGYGGSEREIY